MYTRHHVVYEIFNHETGTIVFFEHFENVNRWKDEIDSRVYSALNNWTIEVTD